MILVDVTILSTFARIGRLDLLRKLFGSQTLYLTPACLEEVRHAVEVGCDFLLPVIESVQAGVEFDIVTLAKEEVLLIPTLPPAFGAGERESGDGTVALRGMKALEHKLFTQKVRV